VAQLKSNNQTISETFTQYKSQNTKQIAELEQKITTLAVEKVEIELQLDVATWNSMIL
jgi:hypothetical protein